MKVLSVRREPQISRDDLAALEDGYAIRAAAPELLARVGQELVRGEVSRATSEQVGEWARRFNAARCSDPFR